MHKTLAEYITLWLETVKKPQVRPQTYLRIQTSLKAIERFPIASMLIADVTCQDIMSFIDALIQKGYAWSTIKKLHELIACALRHAASMRYIPSNPDDGVSLPKSDRILKPRRVTRNFSQDEQTRLWREIEKDPRPAFAVIGVLLDTGMRVNEALALNWSDVDLARKAITVHSTMVRVAGAAPTKAPAPKTFSSNRTIPILPRALRLLSRLRRESVSDAVFVSPDGARLTYDAVRAQLKALCKRADVPYQPTHAARYSMATNCYDAGIDLKLTSRLLGHADTAVTLNVYTKLRGDGFDQLADALTALPVK